MIFTNLRTLLDSLDINTIPEERKLLLEPLVAHIRFKLQHNKEVQLNFICTHNSRRSLFSQIWAQTIAAYFKRENLRCFSGGTEATAIYPMVIETLKNAGFQFELMSKGKNPVYNMHYSKSEPPLKGFSKIYDSKTNPDSNFIAILTCSSADENCAFISGAEVRIPITYEDPKISDGTPSQQTVYKESSLQIATELKYVFSRI